jgi:hypothetical protein
VTESRRGLPDRIEQLFGTVADSSPLLIRDAYLTENSDWKAVWLERHAGDEFAGGVYTNSKFNQVALIKGEFCWKLVIEAADKATLLRYYKELLKPVLQRAAQGHLGLGSDQWQGMGWPHWKIDKPRLWCAGEEKPDEELLCSE